jgi:hypothetical protein
MLKVFDHYMVSES